MTYPELLDGPAPDDDAPDFFKDSTIRFIPVEGLFMDALYQRAKNEKLIDEIVAFPSPELFLVLVVSDRGNGTYAVIDGQNRAEAARRLGLPFVPALVLRNLTREQEAGLFSDLQRKRKNISALDQFRADVAANRRRAIEIARTLDARGVSVGSTHGRGPERLWTVAAISAVQDVWTWNGVPLVARTFDAIIVAWPDAEGRFAADIIRGVGRFIADEEPEQWRLVMALEAVGGPGTLLERAGYLRKGRGTGRGTEKYPMEVVGIEYRAVRTTRPRDRDDLGRKRASK